MFEELSLHILDIAMNSLAAGARTIQVTITEHARRDLLTIRVQDDGRGMDEDTLKRVRADLTTTKRSRKKDIGLGLALLRQTAEMCDGKFHVRSKTGAGAIVTASMKLSHVDCPPLGDLNATILALCAANPAVDVQLHYRCGEEQFHFSSKEPAEKKVAGRPNPFWSGKEKTNYEPGRTQKVKRESTAAGCLA
jgi:anti-sigma regulatory factor (Ser/Thr protein kinase)